MKLIKKYQFGGLTEKLPRAAKTPTDPTLKKMGWDYFHFEDLNPSAQGYSQAKKQHAADPNKVFLVDLKTGRLIPTSEYEANRAMPSEEIDENRTNFEVQQAQNHRDLQNRDPQDLGLALMAAGAAPFLPEVLAPVMPVIKPVLAVAGGVNALNYGTEAINNIQQGNYVGAAKNAGAATVSLIPGFGTGWKTFTLGLTAPFLMSAADAENTVANKIKEIKQGSGELSEEDLKYIQSVLSDMGLELRDVNNVQGGTVGKMITAIPQNPESQNDVTYIPWGTLGIGAVDVTANELIPRIGSKAAKFISKIREVAKKVFKTRYPWYLAGAGIETGGRYLYNRYNANPQDQSHEYNEIDIISDIAALLRNRTNWDISIEGLPPGKYKHNFGQDFQGSRNDTVDYLPPLRTRVWDQSQNNQSTQTSSTYPENKEDSALVADEPDTDIAL